ncbi:hypothetical protein MMC20_002275 [Loxospora ochrophaea]|nr:hypothetical protein [Loxospora ochrophaea]
MEDLLEHRRLVLDDSPQTSDFELGLPMPASYVSPSTSLDPSWDEIPGLDGAGANTFFESRSTDTSQDESEHCQCLQHHTELLCALKIPKSSRSRLRTWPALDHTLLHVQEALRVWRGLIKCPTCAHNGDQEVLILALMCVGAVLTQLRHASWRDSAVGSPESCSDKNRLQSQAATTRSPHSSKSQYSTPDSLAINCTNRSHMQVGDFEVTGHDKSSLLQLLLLNMLHKIAAVLMLLREVLERKKSLEKASGSSFLPAAFQGDLGREQWQESRHGTSSLVAEQMMQSIMSSVESLMGVLKPLDM